LVKNRIAWMVLAFGWFAISGFALIGARASIITDIPDALNEALFDGGSLFAAQTVLTAAIMCSAGLGLAVARMPPAGMFVVLFCVLGCLTAIGWADVSLMIVAIFIAVGMFGKTMYEWIGGRGAEGG
jgi:hypothetical protein